MSDKFRNKYRIPSARMQNWDYGSNAMYFVTICTQNRECYFGEMKLSEIGRIVRQFFEDIPNHFSFVILGEFVIMPDHVHGIIIIDKPGNNHRVGMRDEIAETSKFAETPKFVAETPKLGVSATNHQRTIAASQKWNPGILGVIINQYKRIVTINARKIHSDFAWQSRYHDHIIRDNVLFQRISDYITNNPLKWEDDEFFHL